jgi:hypothetical protein
MTTLSDDLAREAEHYEQHYHDSESHPAPGRRRVGGPPPRLLTLRLSAQQYDQVATAAAANDLPVSTLARNILMDGISSSSTLLPLARLEEALRQVLRPDLLRTS